MTTSTVSAVSEREEPKWPVGSGSVKLFISTSGTSVTDMRNPKHYNYKQHDYYMLFTVGWQTIFIHITDCIMTKTALKLRYCIYFCVHFFKETISNTYLQYIAYAFHFKNKLFHLLYVGQTWHVWFRPVKSFTWFHHKACKLHDNQKHLLFLTDSIKSTPASVEYTEFSEHFMKMDTQANKSWTDGEIKAKQAYGETVLSRLL